MSQDDNLTPRPPTGLVDLDTEIRLMIFEEVFQEAVGNASRHPLLHVCRTTRLEYITACSGKISLYITDWCSPFEDQKPKPSFIIRRNFFDKKCLLLRRFYHDHPIFNDKSDFDTVYTHGSLTEDFGAFAIRSYGGFLIYFKVESKDRLVPMALTRSDILTDREGHGDHEPVIRQLAEARVAQWSLVTDTQKHERGGSTFTHGWLSGFIEMISDKDSVGDLIMAVYGDRYDYPASIAEMWQYGGTFFGHGIHRGAYFRRESCI